MTKLYLFDGELLDDTRAALLGAADDCCPQDWEEVRTGSQDTVLAGPDHFIKLLARSPLSRAWRWPPARLLIALLGRGASLTRRERSMNMRGIETAVITARGLVAGREFLVTHRVTGTALRFLLPELARPEKLLLIDALAKIVAKLHESGIYHGDLNCYNIMVVPAEGGRPMQFCFLDNGSTSISIRKHPISNRRALRNLSQLNFWILPGQLNRPDRLRFLKTYLQARNKTELKSAWWHSLQNMFSFRIQRKRMTS